MSIKPIYTDEYFMGEALKEAQKAYGAGEVPVGAVVVAHNRIIARAHNLTEALNDVTAHAEMQAITAAANAIGGKYLHECTVYITLEPCIMCAAALGWSQAGKIVFGATDSRKGFSNVQAQHVLHPKTLVKSGIMETECSKIIKDFFASKRQ